jgi:hypothetical protein
MKKRKGKPAAKIVMNHAQMWKYYENGGEYLCGKDIHNRWHSASLAFPLNVAKCTLVKQAHLHEHRQCLKGGFLEKSKLAQQAYEKGHRVSWDEVRNWGTESNSSTVNERTCPYGMLNQSN